MKTCFNCKARKEFSAFGKCSYKKDGLQGSCRECISKVQKEARRNGGAKKIEKGSYFWYLQQTGMFDYYKNYTKQ